jgi:hypothetical protein
MGTGEKYFKPLDNSGLFRTFAINPELANRNIEKRRPAKNRTFEMLNTISFPCARLKRGKK